MREKFQRLRERCVQTHERGVKISYNSLTVAGSCLPIHSEEAFSWETFWWRIRRIRRGYVLLQRGLELALNLIRCSYPFFARSKHVL